MMERTFVMLKPDAVRRRLVGRILAELEAPGDLSIERLEMGVTPPELAEAHYREHWGKPFYLPLIAFVTSGPVVRLVLSGEGAIGKVRERIGATNPKEAHPDSIRGKLHDPDPDAPIRENLIHASDSPESAEREIELWFGKEGS